MNSNERPRCESYTGDANVGTLGSYEKVGVSELLAGYRGIVDVGIERAHLPEYRSTARSHPPHPGW